MIWFIRDFSMQQYSNSSYEKERHRNYSDKNGYLNSRWREVHEKQCEKTQSNQSISNKVFPLSWEYIDGGVSVSHRMNNDSIYFSLFISIIFAKIRNETCNTSIFPYIPNYVLPKCKICMAPHTHLTVEFCGVDFLKYLHYSSVSFRTFGGFLFQSFLRMQESNSPLFFYYVLSIQTKTILAKYLAPLSLTLAVVLLSHSERVSESLQKLFRHQRGILISYFFILWTLQNTTHKFSPTSKLAEIQNPETL